MLSPFKQAHARIMKKGRREKEVVFFFFLLFSFVLSKNNHFIWSHLRWRKGSIDVEA